MSDVDHSLGRKNRGNDVDLPRIPRYRNRINDLLPSIGWRPLPFYTVFVRAYEGVDGFAIDVEREDC